MQGLFRILVFAQDIYALYDHQTVHTRASKRARRDDEPDEHFSEIFWAPTTTTAFTAAADTTGVLREYVLRNCCATYTLFPCS